MLHLQKTGHLQLGHPFLSHLLHQNSPLHQLSRFVHNLKPASAKSLQETLTDVSPFRYPALLICPFATVNKVISLHIGNPFKLTNIPKLILLKIKLAEYFYKCSMTSIISHTSFIAMPNFERTEKQTPK